MDLITELLFWTRIWIMEFGILLGVIIIRYTQDRPRQPLNKQSIGLMIVIVGTGIYLMSNTGLFLVDLIDICKNMQENLNCFTDKEVSSKLTIFLYGFFATIAIMFGNVLVAMYCKNNSHDHNVPTGNR